jgi:hypothetical protein
MLDTMTTPGTGATATAALTGVDERTAVVARFTVKASKTT